MDTEGATCDECGSKIGPYGCCAQRRHDAHEAAVLKALVARQYEALLRAAQVQN